VRPTSVQRGKRRFRRSFRDEMRLQRGPFSRPPIFLKIKGLPNLLKFLFKIYSKSTIFSQLRGDPLFGAPKMRSPGCAVGGSVIDLFSACYVFSAALSGPCFWSPMFGKNESPRNLLKFLFKIYSKSRIFGQLRGDPHFGAQKMRSPGCAVSVVPSSSFGGALCCSRRFALGRKRRGPGNRPAWVCVLGPCLGSVRASGVW